MIDRSEEIREIVNLGRNMHIRAVQIEQARRKHITAAPVIDR